MQVSLWFDQSTWSGTGPKLVTTINFSKLSSSLCLCKKSLRGILWINGFKFVVVKRLMHWWFRQLWLSEEYAFSTTFRRLCFSRGGIIHIWTCTRKGHSDTQWKCLRMIRIQSKAGYTWLYQSQVEELLTRVAHRSWNATTPMRQGSVADRLCHFSSRDLDLPILRAMEPGRVTPYSPSRGENRSWNCTGTVFNDVSMYGTTVHIVCYYYESVSG